MMNKDDTQNLRSDYDLDKLEIEDLLTNPLDMMKSWFQHALDLDIPETNAMTLATVNADGQPSARTVLLKEFNDTGFIFYTNYQSRKAQELEQNPKAGILLFWKEIQRQIRIEGVVEKVSEEASKAYFQSRPKGSQLGAWASPQSRIIADRSTLEDRLEELQTIYQNYERLPLPSYWGGYCLKPHYYEFWQGRKNRLHDRFDYRKNGGNQWVINRLAP